MLKAQKYNIQARKFQNHFYIYNVKNSLHEGKTYRGTRRSPNSKH
jgi:hypothetical protein